MANAFLGETTLQGDDGNVYTLRLDFNAMCAFEEKTGLNALDAFGELEAASQPNGHNPKLSLMRSIMWAALTHHHPDITLEEAGALLSQNFDALEKVMAAMLPDSEEAKTLGKQKAKPKAKAS